MLFNVVLPEIKFINASVETSSLSLFCGFQCRVNPPCFPVLWPIPDESFFTEMKRIRILAWSPAGDGPMWCVSPVSSTCGKYILLLWALHRRTLKDLHWCLIHNTIFKPSEQTLVECLMDGWVLFCCHKLQTCNYNITIEAITWWPLQLRQVKFIFFV